MAEQVVLQCSECKFCCYTMAAFQAHDCDVSSNPTADIPYSTGTSTDRETDSQADKPATWTKERSRLLLSLYKERCEKFNNSTYKKKTLWMEICEIINQQTGSEFDAPRVEGRWKTMLASYRKFKDHMNKTGSERKEYEFSREMDDIMGESHSTTPAFKFSSSVMTLTDQSQPGTSGTVQVQTAQSQDQGSTSSNSDKEEDSTTMFAGKSKTKRKCKGEGKGAKKRRTSGVSQIINFLEKHTENIDKKEAEEKKKEEENRKRAEEMHTEQMKILQGLSNILGRVLDSQSKKDNIQ